MVSEKKMCRYAGGSIIILALTAIMEKLTFEDFSHINASGGRSIGPSVKHVDD